MPNPRIVLTPVSNDDTSDEPLEHLSGPYVLFDPTGEPVFPVWLESSAELSQAEFDEMLAALQSGYVP